MPIHYMVKDKNSNNTESVNSIFVLRIECKSSKSSKSGKSKFEVVIEELSNIEELRKIKELNNKCVLFYVDEKCKDKFKKIITEEKFKNRFLNKDLKIFISKLESKGLEKGFKIMDMEIMEKENTERCDTKSPLNDNVTISSNSGRTIQC